MTSWGQGKHEMISIGERTGEPRIAEAVAMTCEHLTGPVLGNNFDVNFGFSGMRKLAEQLRDKGKKGWAQRWADDDGKSFVGQALVGDRARGRLRRAGPESRRGPLHRGAGHPAAHERAVRQLMTGPSVSS